MKKRVLWGLFVIVLVIQFIRPSRNHSLAQPADAIMLNYPTPDSVQHILRKACFDCHSNNTTYPWYYNFQPVAWWLSGHIKAGKRALNFSTFNTYPLPKQANKLKELQEAVSQGWMPLGSYKSMHKEAKLSPTEKQLLVQWAAQTIDSIRHKTPLQQP